MGILLVQTVNTLNDKGLRYKAIEKEGIAAFQFGLVVPDIPKATLSREVVEITPEKEGITVTLMGTEKKLDSKGFETFVDTIIKLKAMQEEEAKIIADLIA